MNKVIRITTVPITMKNLMVGQMKFMSDQYEMIGISSGGDLLDEVTQRSGARTIEVNMTRTISPFADLAALIKLVRIMLKEKPTIVHTHTPKAGVLGMVAAWVARVPVRLHTVGGMPLMETKGLKRRLLEFVEKITYRCAHMVYPNSRNLKQFILESELCREHKLKVIANGSSNGVNCAHFSREMVSDKVVQELKSSLQINSSDFVFCFIGRIVGAKGINELVKAFVRLYDTNPKLKLLIIGMTEPELDPLDSTIISHLNEHPGIRNIPYQQDVRPYLAITDVLSFPSYREGFPNVIMEAGAMSVPAIVTNINGCNEIIEDGVNGIIIPAKDEHALEQAMRNISSDPSLLSRLKSNCRTRIVNKYDQKFVWKEILKEYRLQQQQSKTQQYVPKFS